MPANTKVESSGTGTPMRLSRANVRPDGGNLITARLTSGPIVRLKRASEKAKGLGSSGDVFTEVTHSDADAMSKSSTVKPGVSLSVMVSPTSN